MAAAQFFSPGGSRLDAWAAAAPVGSLFFPGSGGEVLPVAAVA
jgi:hypothetical protein